MFEFLIEGFLWGVIWLTVGWNVPQPAWAKWVQGKAVDVFHWAQNKIRSR